ncbi:hypothetical protein AKJ09_01872 [Labilithrix luteola]|uniref:Uncharacterized protein n=1 Tax=Labilithrix luteola TaxID=1391654 RepID=A0A0K1PNW8_9BACT|nr:hypothetical protein [Labilithrix luteola]AKU95208.1 hypothetical protein AKJ09_01872 [Labilithrix luteola]
MRALFFRTTWAAITLVVAACATSESLVTENDAGNNVIPDDAAAPEAATRDASVPIEAGADGSADGGRCSSDGWCLTPLVDDDFQFSDVWPLADGAFAVGTSSTRGMKVLEWEDATQSWTYIDDGTQNQLRARLTNVWAPSKDEVYFTLLHVGILYGEPNGYGAYVYHGKRPVPPGTKWTWARSRVICGTVKTMEPKVSGTSADDVYLTSCETIYRLTGAIDVPDGGASPWTTEYVDEDPATFLNFHGFASTSPGDTWFVGSRAQGTTSCTVLLRKTGVDGGIERVADSTPLADGCQEQPGRLTINGDFRESFVAPAKDRLVGVRYSRDVKNQVVRVARESDGHYSVDESSPSPTFNVILSRVWGHSDDDLWLVAQSSFGNNPGRVLRGRDLWSGTGTYEYSTLFINETPNTKPLSQIRGTSNNNLWAVGDGRAFHKTTP